MPGQGHGGPEEGEPLPPVVGDPRRALEPAAWETAGNEQARQLWIPAIDIYESEEAFIIEADLPGVHGLDVDGTRVRCEVDTDKLDGLLKRLTEAGVRSLTSRPPYAVPPTKSILRPSLPRTKKTVRPKIVKRMVAVNQ